MANNMIKEYLLTTDAFKKPMELEGKKAIGVMLTRLLILEKGQNPLHPDMGVGIGTKYRYMMESELDDLKQVITNQVATYLPRYQTVAVYLVPQTSGLLNIHIKIDDTVYVYDSEQAEKQVAISDYSGY